MPVSYVHCPGLQRELDFCLCLCHQYKASQGVQFYLDLCRGCFRFENSVKFNSKGSKKKRKKS
jgi:hypothetical protein